MVDYKAWNDTSIADGDRIKAEEWVKHIVDQESRLVSANNLSDIADAATAFGSIKQDATDAATGVVELATTAEVVTGTDTDRVVTPAGLSARLESPGEIGGTSAAPGNFTSLNITTDPVDGAGVGGRTYNDGRYKFILVSEEKIDDYSVVAPDLGNSLRMNATDAKTFTLPSVSATEDGKRITLSKIGAGKVTIQCADTDTIGDSSAGGSLYCDTAAETSSNVTIEYVHTNTNWMIISDFGTWVST